MTTTSATTTRCPGCGATNSLQTRRCRICARLINRRVPHLDRGLAALHPDTGHGTSFAAAWGRGPSVDPAPVEPSPDRVDDAAPAATGGRGGPREAAAADAGDAVEDVGASAAPRWVSFPAEATIP